MFYQILLSPQVKQSAIIIYNHGLYESPHELPHELLKLVNDYGFLGNKDMHEMMAATPYFKDESKSLKKGSSDKAKGASQNSSNSKTTNPT